VSLVLFFLDVWLYFPVCWFNLWPVFAVKTCTIGPLSAVTHLALLAFLAIPSFLEPFFFFSAKTSPPPAVQGGGPAFFHVHETFFFAHSTFPQSLSSCFHCRLSFLLPQHFSPLGNRVLFSRSRASSPGPVFRPFLRTRPPPLCCVWRGGPPWCFPAFVVSFCFSFHRMTPEYSYFSLVVPLPGFCKSPISRFLFSPQTVFNPPPHQGETPFLISWLRPFFFCKWFFSSGFIPLSTLDFEVCLRTVLPFG